GAIRKAFAENPKEFDPRFYLKPAKEAMRKVCAQRFNEFGATGWASKIAPLPLSTMAKRYAKGELDPKIGASAKVAAEELELRASHADLQREMSHPLDRPIWAALTSEHAAFAEGDGLARRYPLDISPLAAARDASPSALNALATLIPVGDNVSLLEPVDWP